MLNEKPLDDFDWKSRLEELDSLPGESTWEKHETWEKLHKRLHGNSNPRNAAWHWMAASCLLFILILPLRNNTKAPLVVKIKNNTNKSDVPVARSLSLPMKKNDPAISGIIEKRQTEKKVSGKLLNTDHHFTASGNNHKPEVYITVNPAVKEPEQIVKTVAPVDTTITKTSPIFVKKKLRVIHINELGQPVEENNKYDRYVDHQPFYRRLTNQNAFYDSPVSAHSFTNDLLKIKLTPQN